MAAAAGAVGAAGAAVAGMAQQGNDIPPVQDDYAQQVKLWFAKFLKEFSSNHNHEDDDEALAERDYVEQAAMMKQELRSTMIVNFNHVRDYDQMLAEEITLQYYRLEPYLLQAVETVIAELHPDFMRDEDGRHRRFYVAFRNFEFVSGIRDLKTARLGQLMSISGTVTRSTEVRPELIRGTFICMDCRTSVENVEQQFKYTEPVKCRNAACENTKQWELDRHNSMFADWQRVRIQENAGEIPAGSMPRSADVILRNEMVERAKPGDKVVFTGTMIVVPDIGQLASSGGGGRAQSVRQGGQGRANAEYSGVGGLKALGVRDLTYKLCFLASSVVPAHASMNVTEFNGDGDDTPENMLDQFSVEQRERIVEMKISSNLYDRMVASVAPQVFGHNEIKRGLLLMLFGGVHKVTKDKANLRGDINVCIVGDPSTSKSQFLKYVVSFLPRAVYTSGKASSAAGLTASVVRDPDTGEFTIEAGALMLADNSVCCIDEFDKMDAMDQTAIHEAMEQQTISISKAGIQATLNARTSILAAANPIRGRYDKSRNLRQNVDISAPIMSRFDLFYVVLDECDELIDYNIARHIVNLHQNQVVNTAEFSTEDLQTYIRFGRTVQPQITEAAKHALVQHYKRLRMNDMTGPAQQSYRITVRQLESMIRLSEALARLHLDEEVKVVYVNEAARLLEQSIIHVDSQPIDLEEGDEDDTVVAAGGGAVAADDGKGADDDEEDDDAGGDEGGGDGGGGGGDDDDDEAGGKKKRKRKDATSPSKKSKSDTTSTTTTTTPAPAPKKKTMMVTLEEYQRITRLLVMHLRKRELESEEAVAQDDLVEWYLTTLEQRGELPDEETLRQEHRKVMKIIKRLVRQDGVLIIMPSSDDSAGDSRVLLAVHPNHDPENGPREARTRQDTEKSATEVTATAASPVDEIEEVATASGAVDTVRDEEDEGVVEDEEMV